ncbi:MULTISPECIES: hypothetical protein [unclassified Nocardia]|uniref:hypothetical protein n=1 Tax=unclassified Nocardia TaxID=2637762 RepID=UPI001CE3FD01|nr:MULTISPECIES: hypothetical protein [unclassified Nocardia]
MPFPTTLLSEYGDRPQTVAIYSGTIAAVAADHAAMVWYQRRHPELSNSPMTADEYRFTVLDLGTTTLVMLVSVLIALGLGWVITAKWIWLALVPIKQFLTVLRKRQQAARSRPDL